MTRSIVVVWFLLLSTLLMAQVSPVQGDDLIKALGQRETAPTVQKLKSFAEPNGNPKGIKITVLDRKLTRIELYNDNNPWGADIKQFMGSLPKGLSFSQNIDAAKKQLGANVEVSGDPFESYYVFKNYPLTGKDSAQVNLEFIQGRLVNVALIYLESDSPVKSGDGEATYPLNGDDYLVMIKKNVYNKELGKLFQLMGYASFKGRYELVYAKEGVEILFNKDAQVDWIYLYSGGETSTVGGQSMQKCPFPLPFDLKFGMSAVSIGNIIGPPQGREGGTLIYNQGYARVYLDMGGSGLKKVRVGVNPDFKIEPQPRKKPARNY